jgi:hypothetical protein
MCVGPPVRLSIMGSRVSCACRGRGRRVAAGIRNLTNTTVSSHFSLVASWLCRTMAPRDWACNGGWIGDAHVRKVSIEVTGHSESVVGLLG